MPSPELHIIRSRTFSGQRLASSNAANAGSSTSSGVASATGAPSGANRTNEDIRDFNATAAALEQLHFQAARRNSLGRPRTCRTRADDPARELGRRSRCSDECRRQLPVISRRHQLHSCASACGASTGQSATLASAVCTEASLSQVNGLTARAAKARVVAEMTTKRATTCILWTPTCAISTWPR
jgi:hypothetical protein